MGGELRVGYNGHAVRPIGEGDIEFLRRLRNLSSVSPFTHQRGEITPEQQQAWYRQYISTPTDQRFVLERNGESIGTLTLVGIQITVPKPYCECGIIIHPRYWNGRTSLTASKLLGKYAFQVLGLDTILARTQQNNKSAAALLLRAGFTEITPADFLRDGLRPASAGDLHFCYNKQDCPPLEEISMAISFDPADLQSFPK